MSVGQLIAMITIFTSVWGGSMWVVNSNTQATIKDILRNHEDSLKAYIKKELKKNENVWTFEEVSGAISEDVSTDISNLKSYIVRSDANQLTQIKKYIETERERYDTLYYKTPLGNYYRVIHDARADAIHRIELIDKKDIK